MHVIEVADLTMVIIIFKKAAATRLSSPETRLLGKYRF